MSVASLQAFYFIASRAPESVSFTEVADMIGSQQSSVHRAIYVLACDGVGKVKGPRCGLVDIADDPYDSRRRQISLTRKGDELAKKHNFILQRRWF
ncbi:MarR family winged helix-turn-helix transcriptional regulator [Poriferisphaera corsica]|nr:MarR family winged helix-turn-helix transcriptional regulator [Poriferisphaera corsica]